MQIQCNGQNMQLEEGTTLDRLLDRLDIAADSVVAEINRKIIDRDRYSHTLLREGDQVELIRFVGGG